MNRGRDLTRRDLLPAAAAFPSADLCSDGSYFAPASIRSDTAKERERYCAGQANCWGSAYPASYRCKDIYDMWWHGKQGCSQAESQVMVDDSMLRRVIEHYAVGFSKHYNVPGAIHVHTPYTDTTHLHACVHDPRSLLPFACTTTPRRLYGAGNHQRVTCTACRSTCCISHMAP